MITFRQIAEALEIELQEKKMKGSDKIKAQKALKKRKKTPEYKKDKKKQEVCQKKLKPGGNKSCGMGDTTPTKIDKKRSKASRIGSKSR